MGISFQMHVEHNASCRMPTVEMVPATLPYLHSILVGLENTYFKLLRAGETHQNMQKFIDGFLKALATLGVTTEYQRWQSTHSAKRTKVQ